MQELLEMLDPNLIYDGHEIVDGVIYITASSGKGICKCPYCGAESFSVHSTYQRIFQDLPIQGHNVNILLNCRKMFCKSAGCSHTTFAERFQYLKKNAKKTERLKDQIINIALETSSVAASGTLGREAIKASKSTICLLLKKTVTPEDKG